MTRLHAQMHSGRVFLCIALLMMGGFVMMTGCAEEPAQPAAEEQQASMDPIASGKASYEQYC